MTLVGHSWGATLGLNFISRHPEPIDSFIFMASGIDAQGWKKDYEAELERRGISKNQPELIFLSDEEREEWKKYLVNLWDSFSEVTFDCLFENYLKSFNLREEFKNLNCPTLCIFGTEDLRFPIKAARKMKDINRYVHMIEVEGAGHFPYLLDVHRSKVINHIKDFLLMHSKPLS